MKYENMTTEPGPIPWWAYFAAGAAAGWLAKGRFIWVAAAAGGLYFLKHSKGAKAAGFSLPKKKAKLQAMPTVPVIPTEAKPTSAEKTASTSTSQPSGVSS